jgi:hypothetical protein
MIELFWTGNKIPRGYEEFEISWNTEQFVEELIIPNYNPNEKDDKLEELKLFAPVEKGEILYYEAYWDFHPKESGDLDLNLDIFALVEPSEIVKADREDYGYGENISLWGIAPTALRHWIKKMDEDMNIFPR